MAKHEGPAQTDEWYTPPWIFDGLGLGFDLDVASPGAGVTPWIPADRFLSAGGLEAEWRGTVWMNPPFGGRNGIRPWAQKWVSHGDGLAIMPNRTGASWWHEWASQCDALLFIRGKVRFLRPDGTEGKSPGYGNVIGAIGTRPMVALRTCRIAGLFVAGPRVTRAAERREAA